MYIDGNHPSSAITEHTSKTGHRYGFEDVSILARERKDFSRKVREALAIQREEASAEQRQRPQDPLHSPPTPP